MGWKVYVASGNFRSLIDKNRWMFTEGQSYKRGFELVLLAVCETIVKCLSSSASLSSEGIYRQIPMCFRAYSCNKNRGVIKTVRIASCQTQLPCHTHTYVQAKTHWPCLRGEQGTHMLEGWLTPGRWFAPGRPWSLNLLLHTDTYTHVHTHSNTGIQACFCGYSCWQTF